MKETTKTPWDIEGKWSVSPYGWAAEVRKEFPLMRKKIAIRDDTFREGDHCIGYRMSFDDKIELLRLAVEMGIEEIDIGGPSLHKTEYNLTAALKESGIKVRKTARFFGNKTADFRREVDMCMEAGADNLRIVLMYLNEQKVLDELKNLPAIFDYVHSQYKTTISWAISDTPRAPMHLIRKVYEEGVAAGGDKAGINDTFGIATPAVMRYLTQGDQVDDPGNDGPQGPLPQHLRFGHGQHAGLRRGGRNGARLLHQRVRGRGGKRLARGGGREPRGALRCGYGA